MKKIVKTLVIIITLFLGLNLTGRTLETYASSGVVCDPIEVRVCSICGNNYDDGEVCPHHIGDMYHGNICTPTPDRVCSICGGDYDDGTVCPHHEGNEYNGEVCNPIRICDICGGNYDDGNECPHHEGDAYGGEECTIEIVEICNICGNDYNDGTECNHLRDNYYDEWCEPEDTRICSICGNDYDCAGLCPHHEGEIYNQQICTITRICNICGGNYDDGNECPHHKDEYYGEVCNVYEGRLCSICGYNYDDGNVCPHKTGQMYNGDICQVKTIKICNICGNDYNDGNVCPHHMGEFYSEADTIAKAKKIIISNKEHIIAAAVCYSIDAAILASCIYAEQCKNVNFIDDFDLMQAGFLNLDASIGVSQVKVSTAKVVEDVGLYTNDIASAWGIDRIDDDDRINRCDRLTHNRTNIFYAGGYLRYIINLWKTEFPAINYRTDILATVYNLGERQTTPNPTPKANSFGNFANENYELMRYLLETY